MSNKDDITRLLDIQELTVVEMEIKENEVILTCKNRFDYLSFLQKKSLNDMILGVFVINFFDVFDGK